MPYYASVNKNNLGDCVIYIAEKMIQPGDTLNERYNNKTKYYHGASILPEKYSSLKQLSVDRVTEGDKSDIIYFVVDPVKTEKYHIELWKEIKEKRNMLLRDTDYYFLTDQESMNILFLNKLKEYRQKLRDLTNTYDNPENVIWPERPAEPSKRFKNKNL